MACSGQRGRGRENPTFEISFWRCSSMKVGGLPRRDEQVSAPAIMAEVLGYRSPGPRADPARSERPVRRRGAQAQGERAGARDTDLITITSHKILPGNGGIVPNINNKSIAR